MADPWEMNGLQRLRGHGEVGRALLEAWYELCDLTGVFCLLWAQVVDCRAMLFVTGGLRDSLRQSLR